jgi:DNA-binding LacI/PurR family transcriptional regulator
MENPTAYEHMRAVVRAAFDAGYTVLVADGQDSAEIQEAELGRIRDYRVDGLILGRGILQVTPTLLEFVRANVPVEPCLTEPELRDNMGGVVLPYVKFESDSVGAIVGFRRLVDLGHINFAVFYLSERPARLPVSRVRMLAGVLSETGLGAPRLVPIGIESFGDCMAEVQRLATSDDPPTAIVSANARLTPYILEGIQSAGLRIPADVSVLCFGDSQWNRAYNPPISVVREDYDAAARRALAALIARIEGRVIEQAPPKSSEFVMRGSIGAAAHRPAAVRAAGAATSQRERSG